MIFDEILVKNKVLSNVWRFAHNQTEIDDCDASLPTICENLNRLVDSYDTNVRRRLSLRTSAVLIHGASKLYTKRMQQLLKDVVKLDEEIVVRNRITSSTAEEDSLKSSSDDPPPEQMMRQDEEQAVSDISMETYTIEPCFTPPAVDKQHSFSTGYKDSKSSKSTKRHSSETVVSSVQSLKKRRTISNKLKPDENSNSSDDSDSNPDESSNNETPDEETDSRETAKRTETSQGSKNSNRSSFDRKTNKSRAKSAQQSGRSGTIEKSDHPNNDQRNSEQQSPNHVTLRRPSNRQDVKMSPTFTDVFDVVVRLPNNGEKIDYIDITNSTDKSTVCSENSDSGNSKKSDSKTVSFDQISDKACRYDDDRESQRSVILMQAKDCRIPRPRRNKKRSKSSKNWKDQATQTDIIYPQMSVHDASTAFNRDLPFGCFQIYDSYDSRQPSKIVSCSLCDRVKRLYCMM